MSSRLVGLGLRRSGGSTRRWQTPRTRRLDASHSADGAPRSPFCAGGRRVRRSSIDGRLVGAPLSACGFNGVESLIEMDGRVAINGRLVTLRVACLFDRSLTRPDSLTMATADRVGFVGKRTNFAGARALQRERGMRSLKVIAARVDVAGKKGGRSFFSVCGWVGGGGCCWCGSAAAAAAAAAVLVVSTRADSVTLTPQKERPDKKRKIETIDGCFLSLSRSRPLVGFFFVALDVIDARLSIRTRGHGPLLH